MDDFVDVHALVGLAPARHGNVDHGRFPQA
jgi:hypothetical protein